jgi:hypothetical protein
MGNQKNLLVGETLMVELDGTAERVLELFDRAVLAEDDSIALESIAGIKEILTEIKPRVSESLDNQPPSVILTKIVFRDPEMDAKLQHLEDEARELRDRIEKASTIPHPIADEKGDLYYTLEEFLAALQVKMGRTYGWRVDYVTASTETPEVHQARNEDIQKWQRTKKVPDWAFDQIDKLVFTKRVGQGGRQWSNQEGDYLVGFYVSDPTMSNASFANICTKHFGRKITENAIRGALDRLRDKGRIERYRPPKKSE